MLRDFMLTRVPRPSWLLVCLLVLLSAVACQKVALLAPSGSSIILTSPTNVLAANGSAQITAQVLEAAGTPPHSGTQVSFTTTLGSVQPAQAETDSNGQVTVRFVAGGSN